MIIHRKWISALIVTLACVASTSATHAEEPLPGEAVDRETLIRQYGEPTGAITAGDKEILTYPQGKVVLKEGKVVSMSFGRPPVADPGTTKRTFYQESGVRFRVNYDPTAWIPRPSERDDDHYKRFVHYSDKLIFSLKTELIDFPKDKLAEVLLKRVQQDDPGSTEIKRERRGIKNGNATYFCFLGKREPVLEYHVCVYAGPEGLAKVTLYGPRAEIAARYKEVQAVMNGLEITDEATAVNIPPTVFPPPPMSVEDFHKRALAGRTTERNQKLQAFNGSFVLPYISTEWIRYDYKGDTLQLRDVGTQKIIITIEHLDGQVPADRMGLYILNRLGLSADRTARVTVREIIQMGGTGVAHLKVVGTANVTPVVFHYYLYTSSKGTDIFSVEAPEAIYTAKEEKIEALRKGLQILPDPAAKTQAQVF